MSNIILYITSRCNLNCLHCFRSGINPGDMPLGVAKKIIRESQALNFKNVSLTGGEPALYPHLEELIAYISNTRSMTYSIMTNGLNIKPLIGIIKKNKSRFTLLGFSIDDLPGSENKIRGASLLSAYEATFRACRENDIPFQIKTCVSKGYMSRVDEFIDMAQKNGAQGIEFSTIMPSKKAVKNDLVIPMKERMALMVRITRLSHQTFFPISFAQELYMPNPIACERQRMRVFSFDLDGNLVFCTCLSDYFQSVPDLVIGNIVKTSLRELIVAYHFQQHRYLKRRMAQYPVYESQNRLFDYHTCVYCYEHFLN